MNPVRISGALRLFTACFLSCAAFGKGGEGEPIVGSYHVVGNEVLTGPSGSVVYDVDDTLTFTDNAHQFLTSAFTGTWHNTSPNRYLADFTFDFEFYIATTAPPLSGTSCPFCGYKKVKVLNDTDVMVGALKGHYSITTSDGLTSKWKLAGAVAGMRL